MSALPGYYFRKTPKVTCDLCAHWARKLKDVETIYSAYDKEALSMAEAVFRVWRMYLFGCKCFSMVEYHATLVHLLKESSDYLTFRQTH